MPKALLATDSTQRTILHVVCQMGDANTLSPLLQKLKDEHMLSKMIDMKDGAGNFLLHLAIMNPNAIDVVRTLIENAIQYSWKLR